MGSVLLPHEKQEIFKKLWFLGVKESEIAQILGIRVNMVPIYARILGLPSRGKRAPPNKKLADEDLELIKKMWMDGATIKEIAEYFGIHETTVQMYLRAMGLRRRTVKRCPDIPKEVLEKLCLELYTDEEIAEMFHTSKNCIAKLRQKYGINKRSLIKQKSQEKLERIIDIIAEILNKKGYTTSIELRENHNIRINTKLLEQLEIGLEGVKWFRLRYTSTAKFTIFPARFNNLTIIYLEGNEDKVISFLISNILDKNTPRKALKHLLKTNKAPDTILKLLNIYYNL